MLKNRVLTAAAIVVVAATPALAQPSSSAPMVAVPAAVVAAPDVGVVIDPQTKTAVVVPLNSQADVPPEVTAALAALYATGRVRPGQVAQIVVQRGDKVTQIYANAPAPNPR